MQAEHEKKFLASKKREPAFILAGYTYWKEATSAFERHQHSATHQEAVESLVLLPSQLQGDIGEMCDRDHQEEKKNRQIFILILQNLRFLACQVLPLRGSKNDVEGNFIQLLHLQDSTVDAWLQKKSNKYISHDIQDEVLCEMA